MSKDESLKALAYDQCECHWSVIVSQGGYDRLLGQWDDGGSF